MLLRGQVLVAEHDHQELLERSHDLVEHVGRKRLAQIDARDLASAGAGNRRDLDMVEAGKRQAGYRRQAGLQGGYSTHRIFAYRNMYFRVTAKVRGMPGVP